MIDLEHIIGLVVITSVFIGIFLTLALISRHERKAYNRSIRQHKDEHGEIVSIELIYPGWVTECEPCRCSTIITKEKDSEELDIRCVRWLLSPSFEVMHNGVADRHSCPDSLNIRFADGFELKQEKYVVG